MISLRIPNPSLTALITLGIADHAVLTGNRVAVTLEAIKQGCSTAVVGVPGATAGLAPVFWAVGACLATGGGLTKRAT